MLFRIKKVRRVDPEIEALEKRFNETAAKTAADLRALSASMEEHEANLKEMLDRLQELSRKARA